MAYGRKPMGQKSVQRAQRMHSLDWGLLASLSVKSKMPDVNLVVGASTLTADIPIMAPPNITLPIFSGSGADRTTTASWRPFVTDFQEDCP